jgi:hypothetical protein
LCVFQVSRTLSLCGGGRGCRKLRPEPALVTESTASGNHRPQVIAYPLDVMAEQKRTQGSELAICEETSELIHIGMGYGLGLGPASA